MYCVVWEYEVNAQNADRFEAVYGSDGAWAKLFRRSDDYRGTDLLRGVARPGLYVTVDRWRSQGAYVAFLAEHAQEYAGIDAQCDALTVRETRLSALTAG
jgi:heme-degrading monooxygenase HmoA